MLKRLICIALVGGTMQAMVFDNRFLPLFLKPFTRRWDAPSHMRIQPFFMHADRGISELSRLNIPDIFGPYDMVNLADALVEKGCPNPLRSDFIARTSIPWTRRGRIDAQGLAFLYEQYLGNCFSVGINAMFAHVNSRHEFLLRDAEEQLPIGDKEYLFAVKEKIHRELGLVPALFSKTGFGDIDLYLRFGSWWDYTLKLRRIESGLRVGVLIPTASAIPLNNPAAIPLGGEKHWGAYIGVESEVEIKEDMKVGLMARAIKRFPRTSLQRIPLAGEPSNYGALVGPLRVDPGWTFVFNPTFSLEGLREGFGVAAQYTLVAHLRDRITDVGQQASIIGPVIARSSWGMEYVTVGAFYDFGKVRECPTLYPKISAYWDIPVNWLVSKRASKTNSVSLMIELDF
jgi:hypothetical protein